VSKLANNAENKKGNKPGGLDGLRGVWLALLILWMVITPPLTTKKSKIRTDDHALHH
jgi:hypothetical protein